MTGGAFRGSREDAKSSDVMGGEDRGKPPPSFA